MFEEKPGVYLGFGSNLGDRIRNIEKAVYFVSTLKGTRLLNISNFYLTIPEYFTEQPEFINCAAGLKTGYTPGGLLSELKKIEKKLGRKQTFKYGPRVIDIDILLYGNGIIREDMLQIPHPRIAERLFVLFPLAEIAGDAAHPPTGGKIRDILKCRMESGAGHG